MYAKTQLSILETHRLVTTGVDHMLAITIRQLPSWYMILTDGLLAAYKRCT